MLALSSALRPFLVLAAVAGVALAADRPGERRADLPGTRSHLAPRSLATDCAGEPVELTGRIYVSDRPNGRILSALFDGSDVRVVVDGAPVQTPVDVAIDPERELLYHSHAPASGDNQIHRTDLDGIGLAGVRGGLSNPAGVAVDRSTGQLYWCNTGAARVATQAADGTGHVGDLITAFNEPYGIAVDEVAGRLYVTDPDLGMVFTFDLATEELTTFWIDDTPDGVFGIDVDPGRDEVFIVDRRGGIVMKTNLAGTDPMSVAFRRGAPLQVAVDREGPDMFVVLENGEVWRVNRDTGSAVHVLTVSPSSGGIDVLSGPSPKTLSFREGDGGVFSETDGTTLERMAPNANFGSGGHLSIDGSGTWTLLGWFDAFGPEDGQVPPGATVRSAELVLTTTDNATSASVDIHRALMAWDEDAVTWANWPCCPRDPAEVSFSANLPNRRLTVDVTSLVEPWAADEPDPPNHGFLIFVDNADGAAFHSDDAADLHLRPQLIVHFDPPFVPNEPPVAAAAGPDEVECTGTPVIVALDGRDSFDADGDELSHAWSTACAGASFDDPAAAAPLLIVDAPTDCPIECEVTLVVDDGCDTDTTTWTVTVRDAAAPVAPPAPADARAACVADVPAAPVLTAEDACAGSVSSPADERDDGGAGCPGDPLVLTRTWTFVDDCGNTSTADQVVTVVDDLPPSWDQAMPAPVTVGCSADVPAPPVVTASDDCGAPTVRFGEVESARTCPDRFLLTRTWTALDACSNETRHVQVVTVDDRTPPVVEESDALARWLWPPNHAMVELPRTILSPAIADGCGGETTWRLAACESDQPEDDVGDGHTEPDCSVTADGESVLVRAERSGTGRTGRTYRLLVVARDACGNESAPVTAGSVHVPHSPRGLPAALRVNSVSGP